MLWDDAHGTDAETWKMLDVLVWKDDPLRLVHHVSEFIAQKIKMVICRAVRTPGQGSLDAAMGPWWGLKYDRRTSMFVLAEQAPRRVS